MSNVFPLRNDSTAIGGDVTVTTEGEDAPAFDESTGTVQIPLPDGDVEISFGGPPGPPRKDKKDLDFDANLAEELDQSQLSTIAEKLLMGIEQDIQTRSAWLENMSNGISLLGLQIKNPAGAAASGATPAEGVSTVDHPLLLEAVLRFQANARGELLPTDGPVKIRNDGEENSLSSRLAEALEKDLNHYLTKVAKEYYPDTDRMLLMLGFSGISFKKGYHDPIKRRPVIASIDAKDLIVSNAATDIDGAGRVTHRIMMRPGILRRMQLLGAYLDIHLPNQGMPAVKDAVGVKIDQTQGIAPATYVEPSDQDRELYECYCEIDVPGFEHELDGKSTGLPLPYKVTIDKDARAILEIRRNWVEDDTFCMPRNRIVAYIFIPGLGFYGIGLLNILGNATKAVTAAWRLMIDAGMFANFPGFLYLKSLAKQLTNQFRIPPGGGMPIDAASGNDIRTMIMPLPYKDPSAVFIQLIENIATTAQRVGGTAELQVGEGKQDAPVGTTLAMIEQATKLMSAVHKRLHQAQGQEFDMLKEMLKEDPSSLWRHNKKSKVLAILTAEAGQQPLVDAEQQAEERHHEMFLAALSDCELVPAADPNTSSQTERYLKVVAMRQMAQTNPSIDMNKVDERAFQVMGIDDGVSFFKPAPPPGAQQPSPEEVTAEATKIAAQARLMDSQTRVQEAQAKAASSAADLASKERIAALNVSREVVIHSADQATAQQKMQADNSQRSADRLHKLVSTQMANQHASKESAADRAHEMHQNNIGVAHKVIEGGIARQHEATQSGLDRAHEFAGRQNEAMQSGLDRAHEMVGRQHDAALAGADQFHQAQQADLDREHEAAQNEEQRQADLQAAKSRGVAPKKNG